MDPMLTLAGSASLSITENQDTEEISATLRACLGAGHPLTLTRLGSCKLEAVPQRAEMIGRDGGRGGGTRGPGWCMKPGHRNNPRRRTRMHGVGPSQDSSRRCIAYHGDIGEPQVCLLGLEFQSKKGCGE